MKTAQKKKNTGEINAFSLARSLTDVDFANGWKIRDMQPPIIYPIYFDADAILMLFISFNLSKTAFRDTSPLNV